MNELEKLQEANAELLAALILVEARLTLCARAFYVEGTTKALRAAFDGWKGVIEPARKVIAKNAGLNN